MEKFVFRGKEIKTVGIFGLGRSNIGVVRYLRGHYPTLRFILRTDTANIDSHGLLDGAFEKILIGKWARENFFEDMLFLSPTVKRRTLCVPQSVILTSDAEFFFELTDKTVFSVTGSDGKSTTSTLSALMLSTEKEPTYAIGNIGVAMTPRLDGRAPYAVAELSSFQLMNFEPRSKRALITNISENHLDFHTSYEEYINAKANIFCRCEEPILNCDSPIVSSILAERPIFGAYSLTKSESELRSIRKAEHYVSLCDGAVMVNGVKIFDTGRLKCKNRHTIENFIAAVALTFGYTEADRVRTVAEEFSGLAHRCEYIGTFCGVRYINSSIDSTPHRCKTTLSSFTDKLTVILGGKGKGLDYGELCEPIRERAARVILTGANRYEILSALLSDADIKRDIPIDVFDSFAEAVLFAIRTAREKDTVILSPASTSFDSFSNFEERGKVFKDIILNYYYKRT